VVVGVDQKAEEVEVVALRQKVVVPVVVEGEELEREAKVEEAEPLQMANQD
jgi:hypothetical protein